MADVTSSTQTVRRRTLRPWGSTIPVEVLSIELNLLVQFDLALYVI